MYLKWSSERIQDLVLRTKHLSSITCVLPPWSWMGEHVLVDRNRNMVICSQIPPLPQNFCCMSKGGEPRDLDDCVDNSLEQLLAQVDLCELQLTNISRISISFQVWFGNQKKAGVTCNRQHAYCHPVLRGRV